MDTEQMAHVKEFHELIESYGLKESTAYLQSLINERSIMRSIFNVEETAKGIYPMPEEFEPVYVYSSKGLRAEQITDYTKEEVEVPMLEINASKDWPIVYEYNGQSDIWTKALSSVADILVSYENEIGFNILSTAATTAFSGMGVMSPRPAAVYKMPRADPASGYFSKELINRMIVGAQRMGKDLKYLWISPEDMSDVREYDEKDIDLITRREIMSVANPSICNIKFRVVPELGVLGKYNINGRNSYGQVLAGDNEKYNDYQIENPNIVDANNNLIEPGETQIYGLCEDPKSYLMMPIGEKYTVYNDPTLHRRRRRGFYGWQSSGMACLNGFSIIMGVIDRKVK